jgi:hypothetical protein
MTDNGKLRGASQAAKDIRGDHGAPSTQPAHYVNIGPQHVELNGLMPDIQYTTGPTGCEDIRAAQHENMNGPMYGGYHSNSMDDVSRDGNPETPILESQFMGQGQNFRPPDAANVSTMNRPPRRPRG